MSISIKPTEIMGTRAQAAPGTETQPSQPRVVDPKAGWQSLNYPQWQPDGILGKLLNPGALNPPPPPPGSGPLGQVINPGAKNPPAPVFGGILGQVINPGAKNPPAPVFGAILGSIIKPK